MDQDNSFNNFKSPEGNQITENNVHLNATPSSTTISTPMKPKEKDLSKQRRSIISERLNADREKR